jgi:hypothetical protein
MLSIPTNLTRGSHALVSRNLHRQFGANDANFVVGTSRARVYKCASVLLCARKRPITRAFAGFRPSINYDRSPATRSILAGSPVKASDRECGTRAR